MFISIVIRLSTYFFRIGSNWYLLLVNYRIHNLSIVPGDTGQFSGFSIGRFSRRWPSPPAFLKRFRSSRLKRLIGSVSKCVAPCNTAGATVDRFASSSSSSSPKVGYRCSYGDLSMMSRPATWLSLLVFFFFSKTLFDRRLLRFSNRRKNLNNRSVFYEVVKNLVFWVFILSSSFEFRAFWPLCCTVLLFIFAILMRCFEII